MEHPDGSPIGLLLASRGWDVQPDGCWNWRGSLVVRFAGTLSRAPRLAYLKWGGYTLRPEDKVGHRCGNIRCINPSHLYAIRTKQALDSRIREEWETEWFTDYDLAEMFGVSVEYVRNVTRRKEK